MSPVAIILGIVIIILIYVLYKFFRTDSGTVLSKTTNLNTSDESVALITNDSGAIKSGTNPTYSYGLWLYVNTWSTGEKTIIRRQNAKDSDKNDIKLYLDSTTPTLKCAFYTDYSTSIPLETVTITNNFPIQKWVYIIVSVDNQIVDTYLDGKLVTSQKLNGMPDVSAGDLYVGKFDAYLAKLVNGSSIDPQTAWKNYMSGNGGNAISKMFKSYGLDFSFKKDNVEQYKLNVF